MVAVRPDPAHPITKGYSCIKGMRVLDYQNDPDRLTHPIRRGASGWERISWAVASEEIGRKLRAIREAHGPRAIATYWGNACDSTAISLANTFCSAFGSPNSFNVLSLEYTDRGAVAERMLGNENFILQPDAGRADFALLLGTNPLVTQGVTLLQRRPRIIADFRSIQGRGGKVVVVDPRLTETAKVADEHLAIRPGTDLFLLVGMVKRILQTGAYDEAFVEQYATGLDSWRELVAKFDFDEAAEITGISSAVIQRLGDEFAGARSAFVTTRVGVQTSHNPSLTEWAVQTLNAISGNIDRPGGVYFNPGAIDVPRLIARFTRRKNRSPSRVGRYPQIFGGPPATVFADDVLSDDSDRIRALVVVGGNPVLTFPNSEKVEAALRRLELLVSIDLYHSDTGTFAHYSLPAATALEKGGLHFLTSNFEPYPYIEWRPKLVEPRGEARGEWEIFRDLSQSAGVPFLNNPALSAIDRVLGAFGSAITADHFYRFLLLGKTTLSRLKKSAGGMKFGDIAWGNFLTRRLETGDGRIRLAPPDFVDALPEALGSPLRASAEFPLVLISGGRRSAGYNSWTHNIPKLMAKLNGNWATPSRVDAERLGVEEGATVRVVSRTKTLEIRAVVSDEIREGVVMIYQFWGHKYESGMKTSRSYPGENVNFLHDDCTRDRFTGMPIFNGTPCRVEVGE
jgi:formate dehydrogenase